MQIELNHSQWHHVVEFTNELLQTIPQRIELTILQYQLNQRFTVLQALRARAFHTKYIKVMSARCWLLHKDKERYKWCLYGWNRSIDIHVYNMSLINPKDVYENINNNKKQHQRCQHMPSSHIQSKWNICINIAIIDIYPHIGIYSYIYIIINNMQKNAIKSQLRTITFIYNIHRMHMNMSISIYTRCICLLLHSINIAY